MEKRDAVIAELPRLRRYAIALNGDRSRADDLVQDTVERALTRLHLWKAGTNMRSWLFTIMHNLHINNLRRDNSRGESVAIDEGHPVMSRPPDQTAAVQVAELTRALYKLPDEHRQVLLLVGLEGLSYKEAAEVIGTPIGTVMSRLARARESLRRATDGDASPVVRRVK